MANSVQHQLSLEVRLRDDATFSSYLAFESVLPLVDMLQAQTGPAGESIVYVCGASGTGKSHLLQSCCQENQGRALYLPLAELREYDPEEVLNGVESLDRVCFDDIQSISRHRDWELALFALINRAREQDCRMVFAADAAPRALEVELADLRSRLEWGAVFELPRLNDEDKARVLCFRAQQRGLSLTEGTAAFIVNRAPRAMHDLLNLLDQLDKASLRHQRPLSIPFVKEALDW